MDLKLDSNSLVEKPVYLKLFVQICVDSGIVSDFTKSLDL